MLHLLVYNNLMAVKDTHRHSHTRQRGYGLTHLNIIRMAPRVVCRAGVGPLFSPGISGSRPAHFFHGIVEIG